MLIEIVNNTTNKTDCVEPEFQETNSRKRIMERPKSAKYNMERYKKSSAFAAKFNKISTAQNNFNLVENSLTSQTPQLIEDSTSTFINSNSIHNQNTSNKRFQTSKSAYVGKLRPQSARHNLEKYRQDVIREQNQRKIQLSNQTDENSMNVLLTNNLNLNQEQNNEEEEEEEEDLDGILIREEESSSEIESNESLSQNDLNVLTTKSNKKLKNKKKLLSKRTGPINPATTVITVGPQVIVNSTNLPNKTAGLNHYTTFRPTAVTTNYSTSLQKAQNTYSKVVHLHPERVGADLIGGGESCLDQTSGLMNTTATNSSSSSTSSSSKQQQQLQASTAHQTQHLNEQAQNKPKNSAIETTSRNLLNEWLKDDDEVDLNIKIASANNHAIVETTQCDVTNTELSELIDDTYIIPARQVIIQKQPFKQQHQQQPQNRVLLQQQRLLNNASGRTSRFSDYSSNSNLICNTSSALINTREKSGFIDPWAKRNPALIAQNVLLKHKAELEQISVARNLNSSRTSNTPSILTATSTSHTTNSNTVNRCLLPDTKYFKK